MNANEKENSSNVAIQMTNEKMSNEITLILTKPTILYDKINALQKKVVYMDFFEAFEALFYVAKKNTSFFVSVL